MSKKCARDPTKVSKIVRKIRLIRLYLSRTKDCFDPIKVGKIPTILPNKVGHLDPGENEKDEGSNDLDMKNFKSQISIAQEFRQMILVEFQHLFSFASVFELPAVRT